MKLFFFTFSAFDEFLQLTVVVSDDIKIGFTLKNEA